MQRFMRLGLMREQVPDATTLAKFRHALEREGLGRAMLRDLDAQLEEAGIMMRGGSIVDATFIEAPGSTKNRDRARDPEAHQSRRGKNWHFGYKAHIGADAGSGLVHSVETTAANVSGASMAHALVREDGAFCHADSGCTGVAKRPEVASGPHLSSMRWTIARKPSAMKDLDCALSAEKGIESRKASVRSKAEHPFLIVKRRFGHLKTRCRGVRKSSCMLCMAFALADLAMCISAGQVPRLPPRSCLRGSGTPCRSMAQAGRAGKGALCLGRTGILLPCPAAAASAPGLLRRRKGINHRFPKVPAWSTLHKVRLIKNQ